MRGCLALKSLVKPDHLLDEAPLFVAPDMGADDGSLLLLLAAKFWALLVGTEASQLAMMGPVTGPEPWLGTVAEAL